MDHPPHPWPAEVEEPLVLNLVWKDELLQDEVSGSNRQLGFVFLYAVLTRQLPLKLASKDCTAHLGALLLRQFHLKTARWGKEAVAEGEAEIAPSRELAILAAVERCPGAWPP